MKRMNSSLKALAAVSITALFLSTGCKESATDAAESTEQIIADSTFVDSLKITTRPITDSNAIAIAVLASGGKAISDSLTTYENIAVYKVQVQTGSLLSYLNIRVSDGALITDVDEEKGKH